MSVHPQTVHPRLARHNAKFEPSIRTVAGRYHVAYGFSPSNCTLIEGDEGCVLVDTLPTVEFAAPVAEGFRRIWPGTNGSASITAATSTRRRRSMPAMSAGSTAIPRSSTRRRGRNGRRAMSP